VLKLEPVKGVMRKDKLHQVLENMEVQIKDLDLLLLPMHLERIPE